MPVHRTTANGKPAYQWGTTGKKYPYTPNNATSRMAAKKKAIKQGLAVSYRLKRSP
jgi:hypothetical protein